MSLLHRHLFWSVLATCGAAVGLFAFVLVTGNALKDVLGYTIAGQLEPAMVLKLLLLLIPYVGAYALPMGVLTGVLLVMGRMSAQNEITAMRAAGLGLGYISRPIVMLGLLLTVLALFVNFEYMPRARTAYKETLASSLQKNPLSLIVPRTFIRDFPGVVVYVGARDGTELRDFWLWRLDDQNRVVDFLRASSGKFNYEEDEGTLVLTLTDVTVEARPEEAPEDFSRAPNTAASAEVPIELQLDALFGRQTLRKKLAWMTWSELRAEERRFDAAGQEAERMQVRFTIHQKASTAAAVMAFALMAIPLGIRVSRRETSANLGVALGLVMAYYFLSVAAGWLDQYPAARPDLLQWVPTVLFLGIAGWLFRRVGTT